MWLEGRRTQPLVGNLCHPCTCSLEMPGISKGSLQSLCCPQSVLVYPNTIACGWKLWLLLTHHPVDLGLLPVSVLPGLLWGSPYTHPELFSPRSAPTVTVQNKRAVQTLPCLARCTQPWEPGTRHQQEHVGEKPGVPPRNRVGD